MDDPNITIEEYIRLEEEKARRCGKVFNWETATYGKIWDNEDVHDLRSSETEFPAIALNDEDNDGDEIDIKQFLGNNVINVVDGAHAHGSNKLLETNYYSEDQYAVSIKKIRRIRACTHQRPQKIKDQYAVSRGLNTPYSRYGINIIFWKISNVVPTPRNPQYAVSNPLDTPY
ncbi:hypothetical protein Tco_0444818 [Tanacetum coccineum]